MKDSSYTAKKVAAVEISPNKSISQLLSEMAGTGFQGRQLGRLCEIYEEMIRDEETTIMIGYAGSLSVAGQWSIIRWLIEKRCVDVIVATGANISEDIIDAMGAGYYQGSHRADDEDLFRNGINRYYDIYGLESDYIQMTELISEFIMTLDKTHLYSSREFLYQIGLWLAERGINSIVAEAAKQKVPVYCPAIIDSPYGDGALIARSKGSEFKIDIVKDYVEFMSLADHVKQSGVFYIGGGVVKDFIQLFAASSNLLKNDRQMPNRTDGLKRMGSSETYIPHKYALQITTDSPQWGGLSGCTFEEAISWGKEKDTGKTAQCFCDATIGLPIIMHALAEKAISRKGTDLSFLFK